MMKGVRVFAVHYNGNVYSIYKQESKGLKNLNVYCTYIGRTRLDKFAWSHFTGAVSSILDEIKDFDKEEYFYLFR